MTATTSHVVDEGGLPAWRAAHLVPPALLRVIDAHPVTYFQLPTGVGKSTAIDDLLGAAETYDRFDLVVYLTATNAILDERRIIRGDSPAPVPWLRLLPRPKTRCGSRDADWTKLERTGCSTYAKATLCRTCPERTAKPPCTWPRRLAGAKAVRLVFATEQQLVLNPSLLLQLRAITGAERTLVIVDEAKLLDAAFSMRISLAELHAFAEAIRACCRTVPALRKSAGIWLESLATLQAATDEAVRDPGWRFPAALHRFAYWIQREGLRRTVPGFRYVGYALTHFAYSRLDERWKDEASSLHFTARPYMGNRVLVAAAHIKSEYITDRLGLDRPAYSPFSGTRFRHSGTTLYNLKSRLGAARYFKRNMPQILDFFAMLIQRNVLDGRSTLLVSKQRFEVDCAIYLAARLRGWGLEVEFPLGLTSKPAHPDPAMVPIVHYGAIGVNTYEDYECLYALNSYYVRDDIVAGHLHENDPTVWRQALNIRADHERNRQVFVTDAAHAHRGIEELANVHLHRLEVDPVLQVAGRVRFFTRPREVILFHMADLTPDLGVVRELRSLEEARAALGVPRATLADRERIVNRLTELLDQGRSVRSAAADVGLDKETARRWLGRGRLSPPTSS